MKYAFNTWCYGSFPVWLPSYPLDEVIRRLARIGYEGSRSAAPRRMPGRPISRARGARRSVPCSTGSG